MTTRDPITGAVQHATSLVGARRYGPALSSAATSGTLSKVGYRQRTRNQMVRDAIQRRLQQLNSKGVL